MKPGPWVSALVAEMCAARKRPAPLELGTLVLKFTMPPDLHAWIEAFTAHDVNITIGELVVDDLGSDVPIPNTTDWDLRDDVLCIGQTGGGDLWVVPHPAIIGKRPATPVAKIKHDYGWLEQPHAPTLDALVRDVVAEARDNRYRNDLAERLGKRRITAARRITR